MKYDSNCVGHIPLDPLTINESEVAIVTYWLVARIQDIFGLIKQSLPWLVALVTVDDSICILPYTSYLYIISFLPGGVSLIGQTVTTIDSQSPSCTKAPRVTNCHQYVSNMLKEFWCVLVQLDDRESNGGDSFDNQRYTPRQRTYDIEI